MKPLLCLLLLLVVSVRAADPRGQIADLRAEIARHDALYFRAAAPEISDADYDALKRRLGELERAHPEAAASAPTLAAIGDDRSGQRPTFPHGAPMLSLEKAYTEAELRAFHARLARVLGRDDLPYVVEPKVDGLAVSATYVHGKLVRALSRGNGTEGEDLTAHVRHIEGFPTELRAADGAAWPERVELRGEIHVPFAEFARLNAEREAAGEAAFAHPRNLAAGTMRLAAPSDVAGRGLRIVFFGVGAVVPASALPATHTAWRARLIAWGVPVVPDIRPARGAYELVRAVAAAAGARAGLPFPTDGAVVKLDDLAAQRALGDGESAPRWALACKFAPERAETVVRAITVQVGRTGVLTPVAELAPVPLGGVTVARATLHNRAELARKDVCVGDTVTVERAGDIIPAVVGVNLARRPAAAQPFAFPDKCPECAAAVKTADGQVAVQCVNPVCAAQLRRRIEHYASAAAVGIDGLGPSLVAALVAGGAVKDIPDLYRLGRADLLALGRIREKTAERVLAAVERSKRADLGRVLYGLGLPEIGAVTARELARTHRNLAALAVALPQHAARFEALRAAGVEPAAPADADGRLAGKSFVLTGTLPTLSRAQAAARIEAAGGKVTEGVSRRTDYIVAGSGAGAKLAEARALGVAVLDEAGLRALLGNAAP